MRLLLATLAMILGLNEARAQSDLIFPVPIDSFPNIAMVGVGTAPDYLGSDDYLFGAVPALNWDVDFAIVKVMGNWAMLDFVPDSPLILGPTALLRFGRSDVDDPVVSALPDVDMTVELGAGIGYEFADSENPIKRVVVGGDIMFDVGGVHDDYAANLYVRGSYPLWWTGGTVVGSVGMTFVGDNFADTYFSVTPAGSALSGLPVFFADGGARDVRIGAGVIQSITPNWHVGAGALYMRLLGDAGDSPVVSIRGSENQFILGVGAAYAWGFD